MAGASANVAPLTLYEQHVLSLLDKPFVNLGTGWATVTAADSALVKLQQLDDDMVRAAGGELSMNQLRSGLEGVIAAEVRHLKVGIEKVCTETDDLALQLSFQEVLKKRTQALTALRSVAVSSGILAGLGAGLQAVTCRCLHSQIYCGGRGMVDVQSQTTWEKAGSANAALDQLRSVRSHLDQFTPTAAALIFTRLSEEADARARDLSGMKASAYDKLIREWGTAVCSAEVAGRLAATLLPPGADAAILQLAAGEVQADLAERVLVALRPICCARRPSTAAVAAVAMTCKHRPVLGLCEAVARAQVLASIALTAGLRSISESNLAGLTDTAFTALGAFKKTTEVLLGYAPQMGQWRIDYREMTDVARTESEVDGGGRLDVEVAKILDPFVAGFDAVLAQSTNLISAMEEHANLARCRILPAPRPITQAPRESRCARVRGVRMAGSVYWGTRPVATVAPLGLQSLKHTAQPPISLRDQTAHVSCLRASAAGGRSGHVGV